MAAIQPQWGGASSLCVSQSNTSPRWPCYRNSRNGARTLLKFFELFENGNKGHTQAEAARLVWQENQKLRRRRTIGLKPKTISAKNTLRRVTPKQNATIRNYTIQDSLNFIKSVEEAAVSLESADRASTDYKRMPLKKGRAVRKSRLK